MPIAHLLDNLRIIEQIDTAPFYVRSALVGPQGESMLLETLSPELASTKELSLAMQDFSRSYAQIRHEAIGETLELGTDLKRGFYVLQSYDQYITLQTVLNAQETGQIQLSPEIAISLIYQVAEILKTLHEKGHPHYGLRAQHIAIDKNANITLYGFLEAAMRKRFGFKYKDDDKCDAPEVRKNQQPTESTDIYALGQILYRLFTLKEQPDEWEPRWMGMMMDLDYAQIPGDALNRCIEFFQRALAERPNQRFSNMSVFVEALQRLTIEVGNFKPRELIADALSPLWQRRDTIQLISSDESAIQDCLEDEPCDPATDELSFYASAPKETRVLSRNSSIDLRNISTELQQTLAPSALEILSRSRYQIMQELGTGGSGTVYKVLDTTLAEILALKVLRPELINDSSWLHRFKRELKVTRDLEHEHILPAYHLEQLEGLYFFTMRYVDGENLHQRLQRSPLRYKEGIYILQCAAKALKEAHTKGIIHRDFKTANIMIEHGTGHPYLMDFGIALSRENPSLTIAGQGIGTPFYMAPEQSRGETITEQADIYSFGVVAYECFTRSLPFVGPTTIAIYNAQISGVFLPLSEVDPHLPKELDVLVSQCLNPSPHDRPQSMQEVIEALQQLPQ